jgi:hypothetical protein
LIDSEGFGVADTLRSTSGIDAIKTGLSSFIDREIEFEVGRLNPLGVLNKVAGLASYRIKHGNVLKEGGTFGSCESERISINARHLSVPWRPGNLASRGGSLPQLYQFAVDKHVFRV